VKTRLRRSSGNAEDPDYRIGLMAVCAASVLAVVAAGVRRRYEERLAGMAAIAKAAQVALLPPLPPEITGISIAARYRSATREASVGGDLYEIIPTEHGIRVIVGDVRGRGLDALLLARYVLSAFRRSAVAVPALERVAREVSQAISPHLGEEDFVTAVLAQIAPSGELTIVNCGHHPPLLHDGERLRPLTGSTTSMPLGLEDDFTAFAANWSPGDRLLLYTDGLVESRNHRGDFLPENQIAAALLAADCDQALDALITAVHRHTGGHGHDDDMALLVLENSASPRSSAGRQPCAVPKPFFTDVHTCFAPGVTRRLIGEFADQSRPGRKPRELTGITEREREVLRLVGLGMSNAEIAAALYITAGTAKTHVARLLAKLGARDRVQLVITAYEAGLVSASR
jgi:phosphoserine phosphatase RsbU/P